MPPGKAAHLRKAAMKKRDLKLAALAAVSVFAAIGVIAMLPPSPGITKANYDRVEMGMTRGDVEAIFGEPDSRLLAISPDGSRRIDLWKADNGAMAVIHFLDGRVTNWEQCKRIESQEGIGEKIRRWLRWPWW
jgi:hypothetical protein